AVAKTDDLFSAIGYGKVQPKQVLVRLVPPEKLHEKPPEGAVASVVRRVLGAGEEKIKVRGFDDLMVFRARCCNPIRGEKIVDDKRARIDMTVEIADLKHLEKVIKAVRGVDGVIGVERAGRAG